VSHYKQQLADKLGIEPGQPGSIHFGSESRGFDEEFFLQLLSEHKEVKLSRGMRTIHWKRIRDRNEGLDMMVMVLCLLDVYRFQIDRMSEPQVVQEGGETTQQQSPTAKRPTWGVVPHCGVPLPDDSDARERHARAFYEANMGGGQRPPDKPGSRWGVQNRPIE
jgi:phage terminase large subunit GpA-like protein